MSAVGVISEALRLASLTDIGCADMVLVAVVDLDAGADEVADVELSFR